MKVAGSTEPASYVWSFSTAGQASGGIASYIGVDTTTPVDAKNAQLNSSTSNVDNSGVSTTTANDMLVYAVGITGATTVNIPTGFTEQWNAGSSTSTTSEMSQELFASIGATGTIHGTHNGGANSNITLLLALKPAGGAATPTPTPAATIAATTATTPAATVAAAAAPTDDRLVVMVMPVEHTVVEMLAAHGVRKTEVRAGALFPIAEVALFERPTWQHEIFGYPREC